MDGDRTSDSRSLTARVQASIERMIVNGELQGGDRVNEIALSEKFGTSRGPLREACRALAQEGLLVAIPNRGVFVRELVLREALEVYDIRATLDELIGALVADRISKSELSELQSLIDQMDKYAEDKDVERYYPTNVKFHNMLLALANNERLDRLYRGLVKELHLFRRKGLIQTGSMRVSNEEHRQVVKAIASRDPIAAGGALKGHVLAAKQRLIVAVKAERAHAKDGVDEQNAVRVG